MTNEELRELYDGMRWEDAEREPQPGEPGYLSEEVMAEQWERLRVLCGISDPTII